MLVAPPGIGKSPTSKTFMGPLYNIEQEELASANRDRERNQQKLRTLKQV